MLELGDALTFSVYTYDKDPSLDPTAVLENVTTIELTITQPDGTDVAGVTVTNPPAVTGTYLYTVDETDQAGQWIGKWVITRASGAKNTYTQTFNVESSTLPMLISLSEAKKHLNIPASVITHDDELQSWIRSITDVIEDMCGYMVQRTIFQEFVRGAPVWALTEEPVLAVTAIAKWGTLGTLYTTSQVAVRDHGIVARVDGLPFDCTGDYLVTYTVGRSSVPRTVIQAAKVILKHVWDTQRGAGQRAAYGGDDVTLVPGLGYTVPNRALEMLKPYQLGPASG